MKEIRGVVALPMLVQEGRATTKKDTCYQGNYKNSPFFIFGLVI
jgi:hypothetical protein